MTLNKTSWISLQIKFQTAGIMPPPYAYFYTLLLRPQNNSLEVDLTLQYLDRDELDEETILDEGFSLNDDYTWKGTLPSIWLKELNRLLGAMVPKQKHEYTENDNYIELVLEKGPNDSEACFPQDFEDWNYFQHELLQAIYEASDKENPFIAEYFEIDGRNELKMAILATFVNRKLSIQINGSDAKSLPWGRTKEIMETIFRADFLAEYALEKEPSHNGIYLSIGDGFWYEFGDSLVEPAPKAKVLPQIRQLFDQLREEIVR